VETPARLVSVKLTPVGRAQVFLLDDLPAETTPQPGQQIVVQTDGGPAVGTVVRSIPPVSERKRPPADSPHRAVRLATHEDIVARLKHQHREQEAYRIALLKIRERALGMKLTRVEQAFDGSKLTFYFTADGRVDFRELVKDLAARFHARIELRQIGVRDQAKRLDGCGPCGRAFCCSTWLKDFHPVTLKMAREQQLSLNPTKISGACGRLMCCLAYELDQYRQSAEKLPPIRVKASRQPTFMRYVFDLSRGLKVSSILGSGKLDLQQVKKLAVELSASGR